MNTASHSALTPGILFLCVGMVVIMTIPTLLRSSLNKKIQLPPGERVVSFSVRGAAQYLLLTFAGVCFVLDLGRVWHVPGIWPLGALALAALLRLARNRRNASEG